jgi:uncharacterized membrane protein
MTGNHLNATRWGGFLLLPLAAACSEPASQSPSAEQATVNQGGPAYEVVVDTPAQAVAGEANQAAATAEQAYTARGQEPGWLLTIAGGSIAYQGNYGEKKIQVPVPAEIKTANGRRYETERLTIEIKNGRCNDAMSGHGYSDQVTIVADGETYQGCGGERRTDWDV